VPAGLWDAAGEQVLFLDPTLAGAASISPSAPSASHLRASCSMVKLDDYVAEHGLTVDFLKADVEGAELRVILGALATIEARRPVIFAEMLRKHSAPFGYHPNAIIELLAERGYRCYRAENRRLVGFPAMDEETVETNFFFLHTERHSAEIARLVG